MAWNKDLPSGSVAVSSGDNVIRDNWAYLRDAIRQEHADPDANASTPANIVHSQGSGRVIVYTGATVLDSSADVVAAVSQLYHDTKDIGRVVIDAGSGGSPGAVWYCTATDTFVELTRLWGALTMGGALTVAGLLTASNGITIPTTKKLTVPVGESVIFDGTTNLNPYLHAARHLFGAADALTGIVASNLVYKTAAGPITAAGTLVTHTFDFSTRAAASLIMALMWAEVDWGFSGSPTQRSSTATFAIQLNDVDKGQVMVAQGQYTSANLISRASNMKLVAFTIPNSASQKVDLELKTHVIQGGGNLGNVENFGMLLVDLGLVGLTV